MVFRYLDKTADRGSKRKCIKKALNDDKKAQKEGIASISLRKPLLPKE
jgi:hypothetical protein